MPLIVEDGTGLASADSYISVADATTYHADRGNAAWASLASDTIREQHLRKATEYMQQVYRSRWLSFRVTSTQALDWPRAWVRLDDAPAGYGSAMGFVPNNVVPVEVKRACAELALASIDGALAPPLERAASKETVGPISVEYDTNSPEYKRFRNVDMLLSIYLGGSSANAKLIRA